MGALRKPRGTAFERPPKPGAAAIFSYWADSWTLGPLGFRVQGWFQLAFGGGSFLRKGFGLLGVGF